MTSRSKGHFVNRNARMYLSTNPLLLHSKRVLLRQLKCYCFARPATGSEWEHNTVALRGVRKHFFKTSSSIGFLSLLSAVGSDVETTLALHKPDGYKMWSSNWELTQEFLNAPG